MASAIVRRRRHQEETADERLDRPIQLELASRSRREAENREEHGLRRLRVEGEERPTGSGLAVRDQEPPQEVQADPTSQLVPLFEDLGLGGPA